MIATANPTSGPAVPSPVMDSSVGHSSTHKTATVDVFLEIDGIEGESNDSQNGKQIPLISFQWSENNPASFSTNVGGGAGKAAMGDVICTAKASKASPKLMIACAQGTHIKSAKLSVRKAGGSQETYYTVTLTDVFVSHYTMCGGGSLGPDGSMPLDSFSLSFAQIEFEYKPQKDDGSLDTPVSVGYNLQEQKSV